MRSVAILGGNRIPFARRDGAYATASNHDMLSAALDGLIDRFELRGARLGAVAAGAVLKHSRDWNLTREVVLGSALAPDTPAHDVQQACGTGLQAIVGAANAIAVGQIDSAIAGGVDTTSDAPLAVNDELRRTLLRLNATRRWRHLARIRPRQLAPERPQNAEPRTGLSMGEHTALTAKAYGIGREAQDALAARSHANLARAYDDDFFDDLLTSFKGLQRDENLRPGADLARLRPVFGDTMTAGNSTPLSDGAAVVLLASDAWAAERDIPVQAHLIDAQTAAVDFVRNPEELLMAPTRAIPRLLARNDLTFDDLDLIEVHEAFAAQTLATVEALGIDTAKLNVNGGSLATGHPFAATGGRLVASLAKMLAPGRRGLISVCAAGGQGIVALLEGA